MAKDKKSKKKQGRGAEKTALKTAKKVAKKEKKGRGGKGEVEEEDIEKILQELAANEEARNAVSEVACERPGPRVHASFTLSPVKDGEAVVFGGEYYNGDRVMVYNHLFRMREVKGVVTWTQICSPNTPRPRSSHQAVAHKHHLYITGGEFTSPSQMQFYHHRDFWRLDFATFCWEELKTVGGPSPRSGHRAVLAKNKIFVFGGFYDTGCDVKYFNDTFLFDPADMKWTKVGEDRRGDNGNWPSPRSACGLGEFEDTVFLFGGYTKMGKALGGTDESRGMVHNDTWCFDLKTNGWSKVRKAGIPPTPRCGFSSAVHKKRNLVVFGGVLDVYEKQDLKSTFYNDVYAFRMDQRRWYPLTLRGVGKKGGGVRRVGGKKGFRDGMSTAGSSIGFGTEAGSGGEEEDPDADEFLGKKARRKRQIREGMEERGRGEEGGNRSDGTASGEDDWDEDPDEAGENTVPPVPEDAALAPDGAADASLEGGGQDAAGLGGEHETAVLGEDAPAQEEGAAAAGEGAADAAGGGGLRAMLAGLTLTKKAAPESVYEGSVAGSVAETEASLAQFDGFGPSRRINSHMLVKGNDLFIFGGKVDADRKEVTLDDLWSLDLAKLAEYKETAPRVSRKDCFPCVKLANAKYSG
ncbi:hypothetical protein T484DRAFT_1901936 [Baffinella frigidus]|nr:hypothetical protein T484DRAFT_1901936 [Cryptophyta sp. CCMP2293]